MRIELIEKIVFVLAVMLALGPALRIGRHYLVLPWRWVGTLPTQDLATPGRMIVFAGEPEKTAAAERSANTYLGDFIGESVRWLARQPTGAAGQKAEQVAQGVEPKCFECAAVADDAPSDGNRLDEAIEQ